MWVETGGGKRTRFGNKEKEEPKGRIFLSKTDSFSRTANWRLNAFNLRTVHMAVPGVPARLWLLYSVV